MKYVRTRDGIFEPITDINSKSYNFKAKFHGSYVIVSKSTIIKTGDTIEELCDAFVIKEPDGTRRVVSAVPCSVCENETVYGHIWSWDNLIKVAKMNKKGEWELV